MVDYDETANDIAKMISDGDTKNAKESVEKVIDSVPDKKAFITYVIERSVDMLDKKFAEGRIYLPNIIESSNLLNELISEYGFKENTKKTVIIGTAYGDIHEIGKNLCAATLRCNGYNVIDLGCDVPAERFVETAKEDNCCLIAISSAMSTTKPVQRVVVNMSRDELKNIYVIVGGASCSQKWCETIKADGYSGNWREFIRLVDKLIGE